ncbi:PD-(D/E)XK nuclease family protein [Luteibaculum oceani]|uniref:PD-(D/E)XK endonuclease-like domain-containing protein n=1 Tax=Luteibaculum oceani TaxID=1294296 RepID=A0A5C6VD03_9FLAO|nr:PD-(D/E)XK nuclease family protein [Luteibaculum oceani]TXC81505.1 hypothetical protein FRX97_05725 [Luteibaculum oceani]
MDLNSQKNSFLHQVWKEAKRIISTGTELTLILPSARSIAYIKQIAARDNDTFLLPEITTLSAFANKFHPIEQGDEMALLICLYEEYSKLNLPESKSFESFIPIGKTLLNDFNEIDLAAVDASKIFVNLEGIKELEAWNLDPDELNISQKNYSAFWQKLGALYLNFSNALDKKGLSYTGKKYLELSKSSHQYDGFCLFAGFNILSKAEQGFIRQFLSNGKLILEEDSSFTHIPNHESKLRLPDIFQPQRDILIQTQFTKVPKTININEHNESNTAVDYCLEQLEQLSTQQISSTAIVLPNTDLVKRFLERWPNSIPAPNISAGLKLKNLPIYAFLQGILNALSDKQGNFYSWQSIAPLLGGLVGKSKLEYQDFEAIKSEFIDWERIKELTQPGHAIEILPIIENNAVADWPSLLYKFLEKQHLIGEEENFFFHHWAEIIDTNIKLLTDSNLLAGVSPQFLLKTTLREVGEVGIPIKGDRFSGPQILGPLEMRNLDFENIFLFEVNEGNFPARVRDKTYLPNDLRAHFKLPLFRQKEHIYGYYFYRLFYRVNRMEVFYSNQEGLDPTLPSRYIKQLENEVPINSECQIIHRKLLSKTVFKPVVEPTKFEMTEEIRNEILTHFKTRGISVSSFNKFISCPLDFYFRYILKAPEKAKPGEFPDKNFGSLFHDTLELAYKQFKKDDSPLHLTMDLIRTIEKSAFEILEDKTKEAFGEAQNLDPKFLIHGHSCKVLIENWFKEEKKLIANHKKVLLHGIELNLERTYPIQTAFGEFPLKIRGFVDRVHEADGMHYVLDFKTKELKETKINFTEKNNEYGLKYLRNDLRLQLMVYAMLYYDTFNKISQPVLYSPIKVSLGFKPLLVPKGENYIPELKQILLGGISDALNEILGEEVLQHNSESQYCEYCK